MIKIDRQTKIKYRKIFEDYLLKKYSAKINRPKHPNLFYRKTQLRML